MLTQSFCWELCWEQGVHKTSEALYKLPGNVDLAPIFSVLAKDSGLPIYEKLAAGPVSRTPRMDRPLNAGGTVDIYKAILLAVAETGPKKSLTYDEIRASLNKILADKIPQKLEVSNALRHLSKIAATTTTTGERPLEWDDEMGVLNISDPYLRFFLKWELRQRNG